MSEQDPYADFTEVPTAEKTVKLADLMAELEKAETAVEEAEADLKKKQTRVKDLEEREIPDLMSEMRMEKFKSTDGLEVEVKPDIHASIKKADSDAAFKWLNDNKHGGLLKHELSITFAKTQDADAKKVRAELEARFPGNVMDSVWVEPQTLKAFCKKIYTEKDFPKHLFNIHEFRRAKIKRPS